MCVIVCVIDTLKNEHTVNNERAHMCARHDQPNTFIQALHARGRKALANDLLAVGKWKN